VADVAVLVVAADEGIKPQTKEAIKIILEGKMPFIVAINKIDKENSNSQKVKHELSVENVLVEDWGGTVPVVEISARQNKNIDSLLEMILLVAEIEDLKDDRSLPAEGVIIESNLDKRRGYVATALIQKGVLKLGDFIVVGSAICKIKSMEDFKGDLVGLAVPSQPVLVTGWSKSPFVGNSFVSAKTKEEALRIIESNVDFTPLFQYFKNPVANPNRSTKTLNVIFKSDVTSSLEAIEHALSAIKSEEVSCRVISYDVGNVSEGDVKSALASNAKIYAFRVEVDPSAQKVADNNSLEIKSFKVIYELLEMVRKDMSLLLSPEVKENIIGKLRILAVFKQNTGSQIFGGKVISGKAERGALARVMRGEKIVTIGKIVQLQQEKDEATEVREGLEAGLKFEPLAGQANEPVKEGDIVEIYREEKVERSI
jgi:translation initiation factor IF-2